MSKNQFEDKNKNNNCCHDHQDCDCHDHDECCYDDSCDCSHNHEHNNKPKLVKMCVIEEGKRCNRCGACDMCDLDPEKICDNCGKCLDSYNTNEKGFLTVPIDKIIMGENSEDELNQLLALYGLDDDEEEGEDE